METFIGYVIDNADPNRQGRVKIKVIDVYEDYEDEDIPWASPWRDLGGDLSTVPDVGKVLIVTFNQNDTAKSNPEYIYANHYNVNLENKLSKLSLEDYKSNTSLIFDHKTQLYVNDSEGLIIDHKFNNINIKEDSINLNIKDNSSSLNIGDETADQRAILGDNFLDWFDELVDCMLGSNGRPFIGNLMTPVITAPGLIEVLIKYKSQREPKFLSKHVNIVDNNEVKTVANKERENNPQLGDNWKSTKENNDKTKMDNTVDYEPKSGSKEEINTNKILEDEKEVEKIAEIKNVSKEEAVEILINESKSEDEYSKIEEFLIYKGYTINIESNYTNLIILRSRIDIDRKFMSEDLYIIDNYKKIKCKCTSTPKENTIYPNSKVIAYGQFISSYEILDDDTIKMNDTFICKQFDNEYYVFSDVSPDYIYINKDNKSGLESNASLSMDDISFEYLLDNINNNNNINLIILDNKEYLNFKFKI